MNIGKTSDNSRAGRDWKMEVNSESASLAGSHQRVQNSQSKQCGDRVYPPVRLSVISLAENEMVIRGTTQFSVAKATHCLWVA